MIFRNKFFFVILTVMLVTLTLSGCLKAKDTKTIYIAITGNRSSFSKYFDEGVRKAYEDVHAEYKDSGFNIIGEFYDDEGEYELADRITSKLVKKKELTAIIASDDSDIYENQMYQCDKYDKILICPYGVHDKVLDRSYYDKVFSMAYRNHDVGYVMSKIAEEKSNIIKNWAVCGDNVDSGKDEIGYLRKQKNVNIVDFVDIGEANADFDDIIERWRILDVGGIFLIPEYYNDFEFYYKIKKAFPDMYVISDSKLDNTEEWSENEEYYSYIAVCPTFYSNFTAMTAEDWEEWKDTWTIHGYNSFRMVVDTAIQLGTNDTEKIAQYIHENGYKGKFSDYSFDIDGSFAAEELICIGYENKKFKHEIIEKEYNYEGGEE